ncbi:nuclear transport factor 2 family protein (plasmid) [Paroceanicella profunda]|uniref:Nuclear transport factor 2 family protein n=1 Tax=Paroceanicella profunda TaxID=2579971 RepID=A0A5B8G3V6_9RHOB|nr:nuclear transport factor 2 family protein [Paroceanicella profunda]QDL94670.1 nuclear transport factor 2 family protein [Paroceanicella profunda]
MTLEERLARLEACAAIAEVMERYATAADAKYTALRAKRARAEIDRAAAGQAACFAPDALWQGGDFGGDRQGRAAIEAFFRVSPWQFTAHHYGQPLIGVEGGSATASWRLLELGIREADGRVVLLTGRVAQSWAQLPEGWRIAAMRFESLHAISLADTPEALRCLIPAGESF